MREVCFKHDRFLFAYPSENIGDDFKWDLYIRAVGKCNFNGYLWNWFRIVEINVEVNNFSEFNAKSLTRTIDFSK